MSRRYYLAAVYEIDMSHERWRTEPIGAVECRITYTSRPYRTNAGALRALNGSWGDMVAASATIDSRNLEELRGFYLADIKMVEE